MLCYYFLVHQLLTSIIDGSKVHKVLILGVGRSHVIDVLYDRGFREIVAIDVSPVIINAMQNKYRNMSGVDCK